MSKTFTFCKPVYHYYIVRARSAKEAWNKLPSLTAQDCVEEDVGEWELVEMDVDEGRPTDDQL